MRQVPVGGTGSSVGAIGLGTNNFGWRLDAAEVGQLIDECEELGVDFLDTADVYGEGQSEEYIGRALEGRRERFFIATKVGLPWEDGSRPGGLSPDYIINSVHGSLRRLRTDYVDLLQLHAPDDTTPMEDTYEALNSLVEEGSVRFIGCSNFMAWEMVEWILAAKAQGWPWFSTVQCEFSMLTRDAETEMLPACRRHDVTLIPYRPLAQGFLTGKYLQGEAVPDDTRLGYQPAARDLRLTPFNFRALDTVREVAAELGCTTGGLAIAWLLTMDQVGPVIAGASRLEQLRENAAAADIVIPQEAMSKLAEFLPPVPGGAVAPPHMRTTSEG
ncbi:MAG: aldo/keto reductase [Acidimicrobiia bacterium]|nr:aldo/keto reductase [bacterium]MXX63716.1 aldo/keto reductase [Acidimicrobiia bacterium]MXZ05904.1 aldo/keto reductase [Acidimicrobiia bacterium]MYF26270.1 aldo/keto reductase [Acidimicrobiia bacterium]